MRRICATVTQGAGIRSARPATSQKVCSKNWYFSTYKRMHGKSKVLKKRFVELERPVWSAYEDKVLGKVPEDICVRLMADYQLEQKRAQLESVEKKLEEYRKAQEDVR